MMHEYAVPIALTLHSKGRIAVAEKFKMEYDGMKTESYVFSVSFDALFLCALLACSVRCPVIVVMVS